MSKLQSSSDYLREIGEVDQLIALEERLNAEHGADATSALSLAALRNRRQTLIQEMESLGDEKMPVQEIAVVFEGSPVHGHAVDATFLSTMLADLQRLVTDIVASSSGLKARKGAHKKEVRRSSALRFAGSFAGSFGMKLETASKELELDDPGSLPESIHGLVRLLDSASSDEGLLDEIAPLTDRARSAYINLLEHLIESRADMQVAWSTTTGERRARVRSRTAFKALNQLRRVEPKEFYRAYRGKLDGGIASRSLFAFITEDGEMMQGQVAPHVRDQLKKFRFEQPCIAHILTRTITDLTTHDVRVFHRLEDLEPIEEG